ncbi:MAG: hypothetical protein ACE5HV_08190 [Acidobacteriota bacterium]
MSARWSFGGPVMLLALVLASSCTHEQQPSAPQTVSSQQPPTWFEDAWSYAAVSSDGRSALYGARFGFSLIDLETGRPDPDGLLDALDQVTAAVYYGEGRLARRGSRGNEQGWFLDGPDGARLSELPANASPVWSPDGSDVAYFLATEAGAGEGIYFRRSGSVAHNRLAGSVTGMAWSPDGDSVYALVRGADGLSSLVRVAAAEARAEKRLVETIREGLDATFRFNSIGVSADGNFLYLALAGEDAPDPEDRHRPDADRDLDIYRLDLDTGQLEVVVQSPGDDFYPAVAGGFLYWTHNHLQDDVVVVPASGGEAKQVIEAGQIPYWSPDGRQIAFTYGGWRLADWALNLDAGVVDVDAEANRRSALRPIVVGHHEDFTPAWSPDGRWIAYHSHRSTEPVTFYAAEGSSDDIYIRRPSAPTSEEIRLTDFGWEVGMADWSPDGRRLIFDSWDRDGTPGNSKPWIVTIDPDSGRAVSIERLRLPGGIRNASLASWSPLGGEIAILDRGDGDRQALWVVSPDGNMAEKLIEIDSSTYGGLDWTPDGKRLIYAALAGGRMQLFSIPRAGGEPHQLTEDGANLLHPQVSPDGRWIACTRSDQVKELRRQKLR